METEIHFLTCLSSRLGMWPGRRESCGTNKITVGYSLNSFHLDVDLTSILDSVPKPQERLLTPVASIYERFVPTL